jgi:hypothetical protein
LNFLAGDSIPSPWLQVRRTKSLFTNLEKPVTTPSPQLRVRNQSSFHGILVDVIQLFDPLLARPNVEVIEPPLPEAPFRLAGSLLPERKLIRIPASPVTTACDEVQMALPVAAFEAILQGESNPRTLCPRRKECGTRKGNGARPKTVHFNGKLHQWYHLVSCDVNHDRFRSREKLSERVGHPPP